MILTVVKDETVVLVVKVVTFVILVTKKPGQICGGWPMRGLETDHIISTGQCNEKQII